MEAFQQKASFALIFTGRIFLTTYLPLQQSKCYPMGQLESEHVALATTRFGFRNYQSSSCDNKQKEINKVRSGFGFSEIQLYLLFCTFACLTLKKRIRSIRFEEFEEDFISVVLRIVYKLCFYWQQHRSGQTKTSKVHLEPTDQPTFNRRPHRRQDEITYFFNTFKLSDDASNADEQPRRSST